jgi:DhnA family fructose-bisphosphate aldolase class Ia
MLAAMRNTAPLRIRSQTEVQFHLEVCLNQYGKKIRLNHFLHPGRGSLVVAFDHALVLGPIPGTEDPGKQIQRFVDAGADAVLLNLGMIRHFSQATPAEKMPGLIVRLDWTTGFTASTAGSFKSSLVARAEDALRCGADAVITFLVIGTGDAEFERGEIARNAKIARECERLGLPLIVESVARGPQVQNPCDPKWLTLHTRMAAELGADLMKTEYSGDPESMRAVVGSCPIPILVLGGSRSGSDADVLRVTRDIAKSGAAGVFFGRNVFQAANMPVLLQQIRTVLAEPREKRKR